MDRLVAGCRGCGCARMTGQARPLAVAFLQPSANLNSSSRRARHQRRAESGAKPCPRATEQLGDPARGGDREHDRNERQRGPEQDDFIRALLQETEPDRGHASKPLNATTDPSPKTIRSLKSRSSVTEFTAPKLAAIVTDTRTRRVPAERLPRRRRIRTRTPCGRGERPNPGASLLAIAQRFNARHQAAR